MGGMSIENNFDIDLVLDQVAEAVAPYPPAAMFELAEKGFATPFQQLVACIISIRTRDEVSLPVAEKLLAKAPTPAEMAALEPAGIDEQIASCPFHERKAAQIHAIAVAVADEHGGTLPCDRELLLSFAGVGPKCANLALGIACNEPFISVDIHVHRIANRWGYVQAGTPEKTMVALAAKLPRRYWIDINRLLVPFGKHICTGRLPRCSTCPLFNLCPRVDVGSYR